MGTHWLSAHPQGRIPAVPEEWVAYGDEVVLGAIAEDGLHLDDKPFTGHIASPSTTARSPCSCGARRTPARPAARGRALGGPGLRPDGPGTEAFRGIEVTPYDPRRVLPGRFRPDEADRGVRAENADGPERGLGLGGEVAFEVDGQQHTLRVVVGEDGSPRAVVADTTRAYRSYRFRFLRRKPPAADGTVGIDHNRALLPPFAFADASSALPAARQDPVFPGSGGCTGTF
ncbi:hypothetical protein GCM10010381_20930 [Streptomyces xantholiticus]|nr:hypothetical protein GCM10010381_20930 [Streptomyces xantholiticus]